MTGTCLLESVPRGTLDMSVLLELNRLVVPATNPYRGLFRSGSGSIRLDGKIHCELLPPAEAWRIAQEAIDCMNDAVLSGVALSRPVETAAQAVLRTTTAHVFVDGNGRVARAAGNWLLTRSGYQLVDDPKRFCRERIHGYYEALRRAEDGDPTAWDNFFAALVGECYRSAASVI